MPRLGNSLKDISTTIVAVPEETYTAILTVEDAVAKKTKSPMTVFTFKIEGGDFDGREIVERCTLVKRDGKPNEAGLRQIKRYAEPLVGDRVNEEDFDTNELNELRCSIYVKIEPYEDAGETRDGNRVARVIGPA